MNVNTLEGVELDCGARPAGAAFGGFAMTNTTVLTIVHRVAAVGVIALVGVGVAAVIVDPAHRVPDEVFAVFPIALVAILARVAAIFQQGIPARLELADFGARPNELGFPPNGQLLNPTTGQLIVGGTMVDTTGTGYNQLPNR